MSDGGEPPDPVGLGLANGLTKRACAECSKSAGGSGDRFGHAAGASAWGLAHRHRTGLSRSVFATARSDGAIDRWLGTRPMGDYRAVSSPRGCPRVWLNVLSRSLRHQARLSATGGPGLPIAPRTRPGQGTRGERRRETECGNRTSIPLIEQFRNRAHHSDPYRRASTSRIRTRRLMMTISRRLRQPALIGGSLTRRAAALVPGRLAIGLPRCSTSSVARYGRQQLFGQGGRQFLPLHFYPLHFHPVRQSVGNDSLQLHHDQPKLLSPFAAPPPWSFILVTTNRAIIRHGVFNFLSLFFVPHGGAKGAAVCCWVPVSKLLSYFIPPVSRLSIRLFCEYAGLGHHDAGDFSAALPRVFGFPWHSSRLRSTFCSSA